RLVSERSPVRFRPKAQLFNGRSAVTKYHSSHTTARTRVDRNTGQRLTDATGKGVEWSKTPCLGRGPKGRGFESCSVWFSDLFWLGPRKFVTSKTGYSGNRTQDFFDPK